MDGASVLPGTRPAARRRVAFRRRWLVPYAFIAPNLVLFTLFSFVPLLYAAYISFYDWSLIGDADWVGWANYARIVRDPQFWQALAHTAVYALVTVSASMAGGLVLAVGLNRPLPGRTVLRSIYFMPVVISAVATGTVAAWLFNDNYGVVNGFLVRLGVGRVPWLSSPSWALPSLAVATVWVRVGFNMVVYLAALQSIPATYYDAAQIDGAGAWQRFRAITVPLLMPATFLLLILNIIYSFQVFDLIYVMTGGGPGFSTTTVVQYIYQAAFQTGEMGYASALGVVLYVLILGFTAVQWRVSRQSDSAL